MDFRSSVYLTLFGFDVFKKNILRSHWCCVGIWSMGFWCYGL